MRTFFVLAVLLCGLGQQAEATCWVAQWRFVWDVETNAYLTSDGDRCSLVLRRAFRTSEAHSVTISSAPRNGSAAVAGHSVSYNPRSGFKGEDSFVFAIGGRRNGSPARSTVRVSVEVQ